MRGFNPDHVTEVKARIENVKALLDLKVDDSLIQEYLASSDCHILSYDKLKTESDAQPAISRIILCNEAYRRHPDPRIRYDIYHAARMYPILEVLENSLVFLSKRRTRGIEAKIEKLKSALAMDEFEATLFEVLVANRWARLPDSVHVEFLDETSVATTPDILAVHKGTEFNLECKKFDRFRDAQVELRQVVNAKLQPISNDFKSKSVSALFEIEFLTEPSDVSEEEILDAAWKSWRGKKRTLTSKFCIRAFPLRLGRLKQITLLPSPLLFKQRYGLELNSGWNGIIQTVGAKYVGPTWIDEIYYDCSIKWKVSLESVFNRMRLLNFKTLLKATAQLTKPSAVNLIYASFERDHSFGHRKQTFDQFIKYASNGIDFEQIRSIIFNEVLYSFDNDFNFAAYEFSHLLNNSNSSPPPVINVHCADGEIFDERSQWGVGAIIKD